MKAHTWECYLCSKSKDNKHFDRNGNGNQIETVAEIENIEWGKGKGWLPPWLRRDNSSWPLDWHIDIGVSEYLSIWVSEYLSFHIHYNAYNIITNSSSSSAISDACMANELVANSTRVKHFIFIVSARGVGGCEETLGFPKKGCVCVCVPWNVCVGP